MTTKMTINKAYELSKKWFWSQTQRNDAELHHIYSRGGYLKCCRIFMIGLTPKEHKDWTIILWLRDKYRELKLQADKNYTYGGCDKAISSKCDDCGLLRREK